MPKQSRDLAAKLEQYSSQLRIARASELAALGHYELAADILTGNQRRRLDHEELDTLARIHVRSGDFQSAADCWSKALSKAPPTEAKEYEACLSSLEQWLRHKQDLLVWKLRFIMWLLAAGTATWLIFRLMTSKG